ncbi:MAG: dihydrofolate reductase [Clostridiales bacterium]|nr:dihydrofolate reductase [Clostridiales bacterium]
MKAIVSVDKNWGIGCGSDLLFHIPGDMKFFKEKTTGNVVVMGLATFLSLPKQEPLKDRVNIVLCDNPDWKAQGVTVVHSSKELTEEIKKYDTDSVFIIGGASVYSQFVPLCSEAYITKFNAQKQADKFFPNLDKDENWILAEESDVKSEKGVEFVFTLYKNKQNSI